jgi:RimJ/RimL family protein N-acetyltransferase
LSRGDIEFPADGLGEGDLRLRLLRQDDLPRVIEACQDPEIPRWTKVPSPYGEQEANAWYSVQAQARATATGLHLVIVDMADRRLLGSIGLVQIDWEDRLGSIGYWIAADARRRGVATRAVKVLAVWALEELRLGRVEIRARPENVASRRVAERAGFTREGLLRSHTVIKGQRTSIVMFSLLPEDLQAGASLKT